MLEVLVGLAIGTIYATTIGVMALPEKKIDHTQSVTCSDVIRSTK